MRGAVPKQTVELLLVRWLLVRDVYLVNDQEIALRPIKCRCIGQLVLADHLRAISEDFVLSGAFRIKMHHRNRIKRLGMAADELEGCLSLAAARHRYEQCSERMEREQSTSIVRRFIMF